MPLKIAKKIQILHHEICEVYSRAGSIQMQGFNTACRVTPAISWHFSPPVTNIIGTGSIIHTVWKNLLNFHLYRTERLQSYYLYYMKY